MQHHAVIVETAHRTANLVVQQFGHVALQSLPIAIGDFALSLSP